MRRNAREAHAAGTRPGALCHDVCIDIAPGVADHPPVAAKSELLQIRVTAAQKSALRRMAEQAGQDLTTFVLSRALPSEKLRFQELVRLLRDERKDRSYLMAELNDFLTALTPHAFPDAVAEVDLRTHSPLTANYVAAMVEQAAAIKDSPAPAWTRLVDPLEEPWFATDLPKLRAWLLATSPVPFRRRNIFIDSAIGDRV